MTPTASDEMTTSVLSICRQGWASAAWMSMPLALASMSTRSRMVTMSWSRSRGDSSRRPRNATTNTTRPAMPAILNSCVQKCTLGMTAGIVLLPTMATIRLPTTGPVVQKPMAAARLFCGEKSRIRAGVATRQIPSTTPTTKVSMTNVHLLVAAGMMNAVKTPVNSRPKTIRFVRPIRSDRPANSAPKAPITFPMARAVR